MFDVKVVRIHHAPFIDYTDSGEMAVQTRPSLGCRHATDANDVGKSILKINTNNTFHLNIRSC